MSTNEEKIGSRTTRGSISMELPVGWYFKESQTLLADDGRANVIASSEPVEAGMTTERFAEIQGALLETEFRGFREHGNEKFPVEGIEDVAILREFSWQPPDQGAEPVRQLQVYAVRDTRAFTATATTPQAEYDRYRNQLLGVLRSLSINPVASNAMSMMDPE